MFRGNDSHMPWYLLSSFIQLISRHYTIMFWYLFIYASFTTDSKPACLCLGSRSALQGLKLLCVVFVLFMVLIFSGRKIWLKGNFSCCLQVGQCRRCYPVGTKLPGARQCYIYQYIKCSVKNIHVFVMILPDAYILYMGNAHWACTKNRYLYYL